MNRMTKYILLAAIACVTPAAFAAPVTLQATTRPAVSKGDQLFSDGKDALFRRDFPKAVELLRKATAEDKTKTSYRVHLARALQYANQGKEAEALLAEILKTNPDHVEAGQLLGDIYAKQENWKGLLALLEPLLKYRHDYPTYHLLAEAAYNLGDNDKARKYYEEAVKLNPQSAGDFYSLGNIYLGGNFFALAADAYQHAINLGVQSPLLHYKLGTAYFNLRNYFGNVTNAGIKSGKPGTINGDWYIIEGVPGQKDLWRVAPSNSAIYQIARAIADGIEDRPDIQFLRANIYLNAGRFSQAYEMYGALEKSIPKEDKALFFYYYAQAAFGAGEYEKYLSLLGEAIKLNKEAYSPTLVEAIVRVAEQYNQSGELDKYIDYLVKAVTESPQTAALHLKLGNAYEEAAKLAEAAVQWQMVLDLEPDHPKRLDLLNRINKTRHPTTRPAKAG